MPKTRFHLRLRLCAFLVGSLAAITVPGYSQSKIKEQNQSAPNGTLRIQVELAPVNVIALDREGRPVLDLKKEDFEVYENEHLSSCATMLLIDISHSMILYGEDRITPAKQVALALTELILTRYPKDTLRVGVFGDEAKEIAIKDIPYLQVGPYHTNTRAGLEMAQSILESTRQSNRQIFMVTDGKPTAITENGEVYKNPYGFDPKILAQTLEAASACRRAGITITTFMLAQDSELVDFVDEMTRLNKGRAYYAQADKLGEFLFADYIRNKRRMLH